MPLGYFYIVSGNNYFVSGPQEGYPTSKVVGDELTVGEVIPLVNFAKCSKIIENYIHNISSKRRPPDELPLKAIFAFSYYYDKASQAGLIDFYKGGQVKVCVIIKKNLHLSVYISI